MAARIERAAPLALVLLIAAGGRSASALPAPAAPPPAPASPAAATARATTSARIVVPQTIRVRGESVQLDPTPRKFKAQYNHIMVKSGRAELQLHFATIIFPNGVELEVPGTPDQVAGSTGANVKNAEGTIEQSASKRKDAQRIANTTLQGSGAGALVGWGAGNPAMGAGVGAGVSTVVWMKQDRQAELPSETKITFSLTAPLTVGNE